MTWTEAREAFLEARKQGRNVIIVRLALGPAPKDAKDFVLEEK